MSNREWHEDQGIGDRALARMQPEAREARIRADERECIIAKLRAVPIKTLAAAAPTPPFAEIEAIREALIEAVTGGEADGR